MQTAFERIKTEYRKAMEIAPDAIRFAPVSRADYDYALCVLPPQAWGRRGFLMGEPYTHNARGEPVWYAFFAYPTGCTAALMTERQFREIDR